MEEEPAHQSHHANNRHDAENDLGRKKERDEDLILGEEGAEVIPEKIVQDGENEGQVDKEEGDEGHEQFGI